MKYFDKVTVHYLVLKKKKKKNKKKTLIIVYNNSMFSINMEKQVKLRKVSVCFWKKKTLLSRTRSEQKVLNGADVPN